jgi:hypothetical protein
LGKNGQIDTTSYYYQTAMTLAGGDISISDISTPTLAKIIMMGEATREAYQAGGVDLQYLVKKE